jgi:hypothetical protein
MRRRALLDAESKRLQLSRRLSTAPGPAQLRWRRSVIVLLLFAMATSGCGVFHRNPDETTATVGDQGTTVVGPGGALSVIVPPNVATDGTQVTVAKTRLAAAPAFAGSLPAAVLGQPFDVSWSRPPSRPQSVRVSYRFDPKELPPGSGPANLFVGVYEPNLNLIVPLDSHVQGRTVWAYAPHFSSFIKGALKVGKQVIRAGAVAVTAVVNAATTAIGYLQHLARDVWDAFWISISAGNEAFECAKPIETVTAAVKAADPAHFDTCVETGSRSSTVSFRFLNRYSFPLIFSSPAGVAVSSTHGPLTEAHQLLLKLFWATQGKVVALGHQSSGVTIGDKAIYPVRISGFVDITSLAGDALVLLVSMLAPLSKEAEVVAEPAIVRLVDALAPSMENGQAAQTLRRSADQAIARSNELQHDRALLARVGGVLAGLECTQGLGTSLATEPSVESVARSLLKGVIGCAEKVLAGLGGSFHDILVSLVSQVHVIPETLAVLRGLFDLTHGNGNAFVASFVLSRANGNSGGATGLAQLLPAPGESIFGPTDPAEFPGENAPADSRRVEPLPPAVVPGMCNREPWSWNWADRTAAGQGNYQVEGAAKIDAALFLIRVRPEAVDAVKRYVVDSSLSCTRPAYGGRTATWKHIPVDTRGDASSLYYLALPGHQSTRMVTMLSGTYLYFMILNPVGLPEPSDRQVLDTVITLVNFAGQKADRLAGTKFIP